MISKDLFAALDSLEAERGINKEFFIQSLESALTAAYKKEHGEGMNAKVVLIPDKNQIKIFSYKTVVESDKEELDFDKEIPLDEAQEIKKSYKIGDVVETEEDTKSFGRVAALTALGVVRQKMKDYDRQVAANEISQREEQIVTVLVRRVDRGVAYVEIPGSTLEGILTEKSQIPGEQIKGGDRIKVYIQKMRESSRGEIAVSRSVPNFIKGLFMLEVPELSTGDVVVKGIVREPGYRTKIAVASANPNLDAVGAMVGNRGSRISTVLAEISGEKIDVIEWSEDPLEFIASSLNPSPVLRVEANDSDKSSRVIVPNDKLSLAIGKQGQNVRLASRLTGWKIDVKSESKAAEEDSANDFTAKNNFNATDLDDSILEDIDIDN